MNESITKERAKGWCAARNKGDVKRMELGGRKTVIDGRRPAERRDRRRRQLSGREVAAGVGGAGDGSGSSIRVRLSQAPV